MNRKKLPYKARTTISACVLGRKHGDVRKRVTSLCYIVISSSGNRILQVKFATWAEAACVKTEG